MHVLLALDGIIHNEFSASQFGSHVTLSTSTWTLHPLLRQWSQKRRKTHDQNLVSSIDYFVTDDDRTGRGARGPDYLDTRVSDRSFRVGGSEPRHVGSTRCRSLNGRRLGAVSGG